MVHFNKFMDQRGDAAYELASWRLIKTLERHFPEDKGTILSLIGMNYASSPWRTMCFTNPFVIVEFVWCAVAIWEMQEGFVKNTCQRMDLHCPSNQFRTTQKANACAVTNIIRDHYRAKAQFGEQQVWHDLGLTRVNQDEVEAIHSEERCGNVIKGSNDSSVNMAEPIQSISKFQKIFDRRSTLTASGLEIGRPEHTAKQHSGKIDMGLPTGVHRNDIAYGPHSMPRVPDTYTEFVRLIQDSRDAGYRLGLQY